MVLDDPLTRLGIVVREERDADIRTIHIRQGAADTHDTTPGTRTDDGTQTGRTEAPREEVAVGSGILVDQQDLRTGMRTLRNGPVEGGTATHGHPVHLTLETLDDHRGNISAAVGTVVDDQGLLVKLRIVVAGKFVQTLGTHIRDVDVAHLAAGFLLDCLDVVLDPLVVVERILVSDRLDYHLLTIGKSQFGQDTGLADHQLVDVIDILQRKTVDGRDDITFLDPQTRLGQRAAQGLAVRGTRQDMVDTETAANLAEFGTEQTHLDARRLRILADRDISVTAGQLADHLTDDVVQVHAGLGIRHQRSIFLLDSFPVTAVHVLHIVAVTEGTPDLVEDLRPLLGEINRRHHVAEIRALGEIHLRTERSRHQGAVATDIGLLVAGTVRYGTVSRIIGLAGREIKGARLAGSREPNLLAITVHDTAGNRKLDDPLAQAVRIHLDGHRTLALLLLGRSDDAVTLDQRRRGILRKHRHIHRAQIVVSVVPFDAAVRRAEITVRGENQILAIRAEDRGAAVVPALGDRILLPGSQVVEIDDAHLVLRRTGIGQPLAVRRDHHAGIFRLGILQDGLLGVGCDIHLDEAVLAVAVVDLLAVRAELQGADIGVIVLRNHLGITAFLYIVEIDFGLSGAIANPGDPFAVGAPDGAAVIGTRRPAEVAGHTVTHRDDEHFATGRHDKAVAIRGDGRGCRTGEMALLGTAVHGIRGQGDVDLLAAAGRRIELVNVTGVLIDDDLAIGAGELDIILVIVGHLLCLLRAGVINEEVHDVVPVGSEEDLIADPHREDVLGDVVGHILDLLGLRIPDPDIVGHTAAVVLPGTELTHDAVVRQAFAVRGPGRPAAFRKRIGFRHAAGDGDPPKLAGEAVADTVAVHDALAVIGPVHHDVVRAHTVAEIIAAVGGRPGHADRFAAFSGNGINLTVAVIFAGKGYGPAIRGIMGEHFIADVGSQPLGSTAGKRGRPKVTGIGEDKVPAIGGGEPQQARFLRSLGQGQARERGCQRNDNQFFNHI